MTINTTDTPLPSLSLSENGKTDESVLGSERTEVPISRELSMAPSAGVRNRRSSPQARKQPASGPLPDGAESADVVTSFAPGVAGAPAELSASLAEHFDRVLHQQTVNTLWVADSDARGRLQIIQGSLAALAGISPRDELEGMLAVQILATHAAAMESFRRAMLQGQSFEGRDMALKHAAKLSRLYLDQLSALDRRRGKASRQVVRVEHVTVNGNAVVGVNHLTRGGIKQNGQDQPHAQ